MTESSRPIDFKLGPRRSLCFEIKEASSQLRVDQLQALERVDLVYRTLCALLFNFVPNSGHPGGSISSGRIVEALLFQTLDYDFSNPDLPEADILSYAAGHKAMGLYASLALRNELVRISHPELLPDQKKQVRFEDLLGFRRNPLTSTPLFKKFAAKPLDGHPTPATPFVKLCTGASGVGVGSSFGYAFAALDSFGVENAPKVHVLEGEGGMTPGRVQESLATASTAQLDNLILHVDFNQASIDSNRVCRQDREPGDYVQWDPAELLYLHDWNVISVSNGFDFKQVLAAQTLALSLTNRQPTGIIYKTVKGWKYGVEGRSSHGAGHAFCSEKFYEALTEFEKEFETKFPRFSGDKTSSLVEQNFFDCLSTLRTSLEKNRGLCDVLCEGILSAKNRLQKKARRLRPGVPKLSCLYGDSDLRAEKTPTDLILKPGQNVTLRGVLGDVVRYLNKKTEGAFIVSAADLSDSTSVSQVNKDFSPGFYNSISNPNSRLLATGGICEDGMGAVLSGISSFGNHIGIGSSYGAFIAALQHVAARLHAIGQQTKLLVSGEPQKPFIIVCAHAGPKTGEDGPTHADPQALQLLQENFPKASMITLTPWDAQEIWPLMIKALQARPAIIAPFVTRPSEPVVDREKFKIAGPEAAVTGVYALRKVGGAKKSGTLVLQGNGVATAFVTEVLPVLDQKGIALNVFYVASAELFDLLSPAEKEKIFPEKYAQEAIGITEFTLPTLYRWVTSAEGRKRSLHPFKAGHFLGSGQGSMVLEEAQLGKEAQLKALIDYAKAREL